MKRIETHLIPYPQSRERKTRQTNSQADNTNHSLVSVFQDITKSYSQKMYVHILLFIRLQSYYLFFSFKIK
jgi:hypothetical protein